MSLQIVRNPDREAWNRFVGLQPGGNVFQSYEWGEVREAQGWRPWYVAVADGEEWAGAALILSKSLPGGVGTLLYSPRGPILGSHPAALPALVEAARQIARETGGLFWRIEPPVLFDDAERARGFESAGFRAVPMEWSYWNRPKYEMQMSIAEGEAAVFAKLGTKIRTKVRHAAKRGVVIEEGDGELDLEHFYRLLQDTGMKKRIPVRGLDYFRVLHRTLIKPGMARLFLARKDATPVAGGISVRFGAGASLLYLSNDYSMQRAGWAIQWEMIRWAIAHGCRTYDFGGTGTNYPPSETDKGYGVYQFKRSFGAEIVRWYGYADYVFDRWRYGAFRAIERHLPYGERVFIEWPKQCLYRLRRSRSTAVAEGHAAGAEKDGKD
ncbi:lipid II:glycine glycyltransferase FemX [Candidatus Nitrospira bockiana]